MSATLIPPGILANGDIAPGCTATSIKNNLGLGASDDVQFGTISGDGSGLTNLPGGVDVSANYNWTGLHTFAQNLNPSADNASTLGVTANRWSNIYATQYRNDGTNPPLFPEGLTATGTITADIFEADSRYGFEGDPDTYIQHLGDRFYFLVGGLNMMVFHETTQDKVWVNPNANQDIDFEVSYDGGRGLFVSGADGNISTPNEMHFYNLGEDGDDNYERMSLNWDANEFVFDTQAAGTGTVRRVDLRYDGSRRIRYDSGGVYLYASSNNYLYLGSNVFRPQSAISFDLGNTTQEWANVYAAQYRNDGTNPPEFPEGLTITNNSGISQENSSLLGNTFDFTAGSATAIANRFYRYNDSHTNGGSILDIAYLGGTVASPSAPTAGHYINSLTFRTGGTSATLNANPSFTIRHEIGTAIGFSLSNVNTSFMTTSTATGTPQDALKLWGQSADVEIPNGDLDITTSGKEFRIWGFGGKNDSNYERAYAKWDGVRFEMGTEFDGTGSDRDFAINARQFVIANTAGTSRFRVTTSHIECRMDIQPESDSGRSLGAIAARWNNVYATQYRNDGTNPPEFPEGLKADEITAINAGEEYAKQKYVQSRGENLVTNGTGLLGDNTNFSDFEFDGTEAFGSIGAFKNADYATSVYSDEIMPVDPNDAYELTLMAKSNPYAVGAEAYFGIACYDADGLQISAKYHMFIPGTTTTLAQDLEDGDTVVYLTDVTNWRSDTTLQWERSIIFWDYVNSLGYEYPPETYSRNTSVVNLWDPDANAIDYVANTITLLVPWSGGTKLAGTPVSEGDSGGTFKYIAGSSVEVPDEWTNYRGTISGTDYSGTNITDKFPPGTAGVKILGLLNRTVAGNTTFLANVAFRRYVQPAINNILTSNDDGDLEFAPDEEIRLYNLDIDDSNYERGFMRWLSNILRIGTESAGTGTARSMRLESETDIYLSSYGSSQIGLRSGYLEYYTANVWPSTNLSVSLGGSGTNRQYANVYAANYRNDGTDPPEFPEGIQMLNNPVEFVHNGSGESALFDAARNLGSGSKITSTGSYGQGLIVDLDYDGLSAYETFRVRFNSDDADIPFHINRYQRVTLGRINNDATGRLNVSDGTIRVENTYTDVSNNEYLEVGFDTNVAYLRTVANGTGTLRDLHLDGEKISIKENGSSHIFCTAGQTYLYKPLRFQNETRFSEITPPSAPAANNCQVYAKDNGAGKTQLVVQMPDGVETVLATET